MRSKRIQDRTEQALTTIWAAFGCADFASEGMRRRAGVAEHTPGTVIGDTFVMVGNRILNRLGDLLRADDTYQELCERQRERRIRRDELARRLYGQLSKARPRLRRLMRDDTIRRLLEKVGPTRRRPWILCEQTVDVLRLLRQRKSEGEWPIATRLIQEISQELCASLAELEQALADLARGKKQAESAMITQRKAMKRFDRAYVKGAQLLEAQLNLVGLPTLADAIRPGVGRTGRPLKRPEVDVYPDLVEQVRSSRMVRLDTGCAGSLSTKQGDNPLDFGVAAVSSSGDTGGSAGSTLMEGRNTGSPGHAERGEGQNPGGSGASARAEGQNTGLSKPSSRAEGPNTGDLASEKVENLLTELAQGLEKIDHAFSKPFEGLGKVGNPAPELEIDGSKLARRRPKRVVNGVSLMATTLVRDQAGYQRLRHSQSVKARSARGEVWRRSIASAPVAPLARVRRAASEWWEKLRQVA
ncbi:MAG: hypothetical protein AAF560_05640 [Acidobacteriota bacterium]